MRIYAVVMFVSAFVVASDPQAPSAVPMPLPTAKADVGAWDVKIVQNAEKLISTPAQWNRDSDRPCPAHAKTFSIACALQQAADDAGANQPAITNCLFHPARSGQEGACGPLFGEVSIFSVARVPAIKTGVWRKDATPTEVWAGTMSDAASPVLYEAEQLLNVVSTKKYQSQLAGYNDDPATTFADVQKFFHLLEARVMTQGAADLDQSTDDVEIEIYPGGTGVIRTYTGWFPVTGFTATSTGLQFQFDGKHEVPPNVVDREILQRASATITSDAVWNRADNRKCPTTAAAWSIYCAVQKAMIEVTGGFNHRRPAGQLVREVVDARSAGRDYKHRMMDYNNDPRTHLADVQSLFAEALARIK